MYKTHFFKKIMCFFIDKISLNHNNSLRFIVIIQGTVTIEGKNQESFSIY